MNLNYNPCKIKFSSSISSSFSLSLSLSLSLSVEFSAHGYQRAATNLEFHNYIYHIFLFLSKQKMNKVCLPFALQSVLETLITKCHLTSEDVHGKGKTATLVLRWDSDNMAAIARPDQSESVSFARELFITIITIIIIIIMESGDSSVIKRGDSSVISAGIVIERSRFRVPAGAAGEVSSPWSALCAEVLFRYPFPSRVTAVARKRSRSFCQKCRWQVTANTHAYTYGFA